ncbi:hypothetical protein CVT26_012190, partial [Gymnopilus dilepis]
MQSQQDQNSRLRYNTQPQQGTLAGTPEGPEPNTPSNGNDRTNVPSQNIHIPPNPTQNTLPARTGPPNAAYPDFEMNNPAIEEPHPIEHPLQDQEEILQPSRTNKTRATLKVASLNIRGGGSNVTRNKWQKVNSILRQQKVAILAIHEAHLKDADVEELHEQFPSRLHIRNNSDPDHTSAKGVAIVLNKRLTDWEKAETMNLVPGRATLLTIPWKNGNTFRLLAVYAPNDHAENAAFWENLKTLWQERHLPSPDIMLGDFNMVEEAIDRLPMHRDPPRVTQTLQSLKEHLQLQDGWRQINPNDVYFSFTQKATGSMSRIDRIYINETQLQHSRNWTIEETGINTDHKLITVEVANPRMPYLGKGRWSMPLFAIKDKRLMNRLDEIAQAEAQKICDIPIEESWKDGRSVQHIFQSMKDKLCEA